MYITQADVEAIFGIANVARWAQISNDGTDDLTVRVTSAISFAEDSLNNRFRRSKYAVPLSFGVVPADVRFALAGMAGSWLYHSRGLQDANVETGDKLSYWRDQARIYFDSVLAGEIEWEAVRTFNSPQAPVVV